MKKNLFFSILLISVYALSIEPLFANSFLDMRDVLHSRYKENQEKGALNKFPEGMVNGNLYEKAHAMAELQIAHPALQALDLTYTVISDRCGGEDISPSDITTIFARSSVGEHFRLLLDARDMVSTVEDKAINQSCLAVYTCYNKDALLEKKVDLETLKVSTDMVWSCTDTVNSIFMTMYQRAATLATMKNVNYGSDFLINANADDGPYDLLLDIQSIGDVLFDHNDGASEIHFYDMGPINSYVTNDPDDLTPYEATNPKEKERIDRFPPTVGVTPSVPTDETSAFPPSDASEPPTVPDDEQQPVAANQPQSLSPYSDNTDASPGAGASSSTSISNVACEDPIATEPPADQTLTYAEQENEQTETYNNKLDLDTQVAILLAAKMSSEDEEDIGILTRGGGGPEDGFDDQAQETVNNIINDIIDFGGDTLEKTQDHIMQCVAEFAGESCLSDIAEETKAGGKVSEETKQKALECITQLKGSWAKVLMKSVTQPTQFTQCVMGNMCKEIGDPTGRGMFRLKVCKEISKGAGLVSNQTIKSSEEVLDEMLNVCTTLKQSGALLEHNKTKDHVEDKMMRIKLGNKFAFGISVIFKGPRDSEDPAVEKLKAREQREYLENTLLGITDNLTFVDERNRYLVVQESGVAGSRGGFGGDLSIARQNQQDIESTATNIDQLYKQQGLSANTNPVAQHLQLNTRAGVIAQMKDFIQANIDMWTAANQYTDSLNKRRATTMKQYQGSSQ